MRCTWTPESPSCQPARRRAEGAPAMDLRGAGLGGLQGHLDKHPSKARGQPPDRLASF